MLKIGKNRKEGCTVIKNRVYEQMARMGFRTRRDLAREIGITESNVSRIVSGDIKAIRLNTLNALCRVLQCQTSDIFEYIPDTEQAELPLERGRYTPAHT